MHVFLVSSGSSSVLILELSVLEFLRRRTLGLPVQVLAHHGRRGQQFEE